MFIIFINTIYTKYIEAKLLYIYEVYSSDNSDINTLYIYVGENRENINILNIYIWYIVSSKPLTTL